MTAVSTSSTPAPSADPASPAFAGKLGNGLVRRWTTADDTERLAQLVGTVFRGDDDEVPNPRSMAEARAMMAPGSPYMTPGDFAVVEDTAAPARPLVCCTCFWRMRWDYAGIPFAVTRPEMVGTHPDYRNRRLVGSLFEMIHTRAAAEGHLVQGITGIPYYYRQFGYEYVLDLGGSRTTYLSLIPDEGDRPAAGALRLATIDDVPRIAALYAGRRGDSLIWHTPPEQLFRQEVAAATAPGVTEEDAISGHLRGRYWMILDADGAVCGYLWASARRYGRTLNVDEVVLEPRPNMAELVSGLLRSLRDLADSCPGVRPDVPPCTEIRFEMGRSDPLYDLLGHELAPAVEPPYAWYLRVPDIPAFLRLIAPELERRLAGSKLAAHTGTLEVDLYTNGFQMRFEDGRLAGVDPWRAPIKDEPDSALQCPALTFLQLLMSYRSLAELTEIFPDVESRREHRLLIDTLFPKRHSLVEPMG